MSRRASLEPWATKWEAQLSWIHRTVETTWREETETETKAKDPPLSQTPAVCLPCQTTGVWVEKEALEITVTPGILRVWIHESLHVVTT